MRIIHLVQRIGDYHLYRFNLLSSISRLNVYVLNPFLSTHSWDLSGRPLFNIISFKSNLFSSFITSLLLISDLFRADLIFLPGYHRVPYQLVIFLSFLFRLPVVVCSDSTPIDQPSNPFVDSYKRFLLSRVKCFLVASPLSEQYIRSFTSSSYFQSPLNIVDNLTYSCANDISNFSAARSYFLVVARNDPSKNYFNLLKSFQHYVDSGGSLYLVISGFQPAELFFEIFSFMKPYASRIKVYGFLNIQELLPLYSGAKALILNSISEPWGLVINEAMSARVLCIVSSHCGVTDSLAIDGETCITTDPFDISLLAQIMFRVESMSQSEYNVITASAYSRLINYFGASNYLRAIVNLANFYSPPGA